MKKTVIAAAAAALALGVAGCTQQAENAAQTVGEEDAASEEPLTAETPAADMTEEPMAAETAAAMAAEDDAMATEPEEGDAQEDEGDPKAR